MDQMIIFVMYVLIGIWVTKRCSRKYQLEPTHLVFVGIIWPVIVLFTAIGHVMKLIKIVSPTSTKVK